MTELIAKGGACAPSQFPLRGGNPPLSLFLFGWNLSLVDLSAGPPAVHRVPWCTDRLGPSPPYNNRAKKKKGLEWFISVDKSRRKKRVGQLLLGFLYQRDPPSQIDAYSFGGLKSRPPLFFN